jgi:Fe-S oxidoreductase
MDDEKRLLQEYKTYYCLDCGKCTSVCPVSKYDANFSPRRIVEKAVHEGWAELLKDPITWECLTCNMCSLRCPADVRFINFIRRLRFDALPHGNTGRCTHGETIHSWIRAMASSDSPQKRLSFLAANGLEYAGEGEYLYFMGCLPYYQAYFGDWGLDMEEIARSTIRILNSFGITPAVMEDEVCCGHDLLWAGDKDTFSRLLAKNLKAIQKTGAKTIITSCAECLRTLSVDYPEFSGGAAVPKVLHLAQFLGERKDEFSEMTKGAGDGLAKVTYHDPCRMSKHMGILDPPRAVLAGTEGLELVEMSHSGMRSLCCGTSLWMNCGEVSKKMQLEKLQEAVKSGARYLVTACPKCQIHLRCVQREAHMPAYAKVPLIDFASLMASRLPLGIPAGEGREKA